MTQMELYEPGDILRYGPIYNELMFIVSINKDANFDPYYVYYDFFDQCFYETYCHVIDKHDSIYEKVA